MAEMGQVCMVVETKRSEPFSPLSQDELSVTVRYGTSSAGSGFDSMTKKSMLYINQVL